MKKSPPRKQIAASIQESVLVKCRRRCALCYAFDTNNSDPSLSGQIAHINKKRTDNREENLAYLCLKHHDQYDSKTSQSKGLTEHELRTYKKRLEEVEARRGKFNEEDATIRVEGDFLRGTLDPEWFLSSIRSLIRLQRPVILKSTIGKDAFTVTMANDDLGSLMEATDNGMLSELRITSVTPKLSITERNYEFYAEFPVFETLDKNTTIRVFEASQFSQNIDCNRWVIRFSSYQCPNNDSVVALSIATISGQKVEIGEPLVITRDDVCDWSPTRPLALLESFLNQNGENVTFRDKKVKLILNEPFVCLGKSTDPSRVTHHEAIMRIFRVPNIATSTLRYHDVSHGDRLRMLFFFALDHEAIRRMKYLAKSISWF